MYCGITRSPSLSLPLPPPPPLLSPFPSPSPPPLPSLGPPLSLSLPFPPQNHLSSYHFTLYSQTSPTLRPQLLSLKQEEASLSSLHSDHSSNASINVSCNENMDSFSFEVGHFFAFGSPLGLVLANRVNKSRRTAFCECMYLGGKCLLLLMSLEK